MHVSTFYLIKLVSPRLRRSFERARHRGILRRNFTKTCCSFHFSTTFDTLCIYYWEWNSAELRVLHLGAIEFVKFLTYPFPAHNMRHCMPYSFQDSVKLTTFLNILCEHRHQRLSEVFMLRETSRHLFTRICVTRMRRARQGYSLGKKYSGSHGSNWK